MSKHQVCPKCHSSFVGPDSNINENLCPECEKDLITKARELTEESESEEGLNKIKAAYREGYIDGYGDGIRTDGCVESASPNDEDLEKAWEKFISKPAEQG